MRLPWPRVFRLTLPPLLAALLIAPLGARPDQAEIDQRDLKEWLSYLASDSLQGRQVFTEGLGLAAAYIADHLTRWKVQPAGDDGTYFQTVHVRSVRTESRSSVTVEVNGQRRVFKDGEGVTFPRKMGSRQTITSEPLFTGYGLELPAAGVDDYEGVDAEGQIVVFLGRGPDVPGASVRLLNARSRNALAKGARATIGPASAAARGGRGAGASGSAAASGDFTTTERYDLPAPPALTASDEFYEFLFSGSPVTYAALKEKADRREPLPKVNLQGVRLTITVDADYTVVRTRLSRNVVGIVPGSDPALRDTYVAFGAHYDHVGYLETASESARGAGTFTGTCPGQTRETPRPGDVVNNGADDDGSGTVALMALAKAFATGPRPKRSLLFVWHTGEEAGLYGSRYYADYPRVPLDRLTAMLNIDMIGRNRCDDPAQDNTVFLVGSDRISTELHDINEDANRSLPRPLTLDYELNDPADPESIYTRSDHYSYASRGIPIIFYTTGLHRDYHAVTDEVSKINFPKLARITSLVYAAGARVASLDNPPVRDNRGPRRGRGSGGRIGR